MRADWRSRGVGTALLRAVVGWGRAHPRMHRLELTVYASNTRAARV